MGTGAIRRLQERPGWKREQSHHNPPRVLAPEGFRAQGSWGDAWGAIASVPFSKPQCTPNIHQASQGVQREA